ncbi:hypothetical protein Rhal01_02658 [Rubritalea halochordaticola]|uniref:DUF192 domain-containing protein n=1 Tax=Rubritalea halochordaticola TaxID=714537 RepID=A0ABP9V4H1_9BACT
MKLPIISLLLAVVSAALLSSCSCAIFLREYEVAKKPAPSLDTVHEVAEQAGFTLVSRRENSLAYKQRGVELFYVQDHKRVTMYSSYCPFIPFRVNPGPWQERCEDYWSQIEMGMVKKGYPLKNLRPVMVTLSDGREVDIVELLAKPKE